MLMGNICNLLLQGNGAITTVQNPCYMNLLDD